MLETGEFDYAWNAQVEPEILAQMQAAGKGEVISAFGTLVERLHVNQTDPDPALGDERSTAAHPHPFLTDINVVKALALAIDREILVETGYGEAGQVTCNLVPAPEMNASTNNDWCKTQDIEEANRLLDEAGWTMGGDGVREKDGERLSILYQTSTNSVRQAAQALIKQWWNEIGVEVELRNIDAGVFFGGDPGSPDTLQKFYADVEMYANNFDGTDPEKYLGDWVCSEFPEPDDAVAGRQHLALVHRGVRRAARQAGRDRRARGARQDRDRAQRHDRELAVLHPAGRPRPGLDEVEHPRRRACMNPWDSELWNAADWYRVKE